MIGSAAELLGFVLKIYGTEPLPKKFALLSAALRVHGGESIEVVSAETRTPAKQLGEVVAAPDVLKTVFKASLAGIPEPDWKRARANIGQLAIGNLAERSFENKYRQMMGTNELQLQDQRVDRSDTDYRVVNGQQRPVFRMNIKFHGTLFRQAKDLVGLEPEDCFALATYKIHLATKKQEDEHLPYLFVIISVPNLTSVSVGNTMPEDAQHCAAFVAAAQMTGKRDIEDRLVTWLFRDDQPDDLKAQWNAMQLRLDAAEWRVLSARKADKLLRENLFERVFAVRIKNFTRNYRNAELDMHFSFSSDMVGLATFLDDMKKHGIQKLIGLTERGTY